MSLKPGTFLFLMSQTKTYIEVISYLICSRNRIAIETVRIKQDAYSQAVRTPHLDSMCFMFKGSMGTCHGTSSYLKAVGVMVMSGVSTIFCNV